MYVYRLSNRVEKFWKLSALRGTSQKHYCSIYLRRNFHKALQRGRARTVSSVPEHVLNSKMYIDRASMVPLIF